MREKLDSPKEGSCEYFLRSYLQGFEATFKKESFKIDEESFDCSFFLSDSQIVIEIREKDLTLKVNIFSGIVCEVEGENPPFGEAQRIFNQIFAKIKSRVSKNG